MTAAAPTTMTTMRMSSHHAPIQLMQDIIALTTLFDSIINGPGGIEVREWRSHNFSVDQFLAEATSQLESIVLITHNGT